MATPRLPFLYPNWFRAVRACEPTTHRTLRQPAAKACRLRHRGARLHTSAPRAQDTIQQRYGPAASPNIPPPAKPAGPLTPHDVPPAPPPPELVDGSKFATEEHREENTGQDVPQDSNSTSDYVDEASLPRDNPQVKTEEEGPLENRELDLVLAIPSPSEVKGRDTSRHPHLEASPYEHHFDTYSLVQQLAAENAYNIEQATTLMKAIRLMLALNLDVAKEGLVSKSDIENESYLFRAACSELRTTLQTARHSEILTQRSQRAQLQHEFDILNQKFTQDLTTVREELKGLFNDRKLGLQEEKRKVDSKISELNYEITVLLNSEAKSEVEGLRWVLTRRAAFAIGLCAFMIISALNYSSIKLREKEEAEKKRQAAAKAQEERLEQARYTIASRAQGTQTDDGRPSIDYEGTLG